MPKLTRNYSQASFKCCTPTFHLAWLSLSQVMQKFIWDARTLFITRAFLLGILMTKTAVLPNAETVELDTILDGNPYQHGCLITAVRFELENQQVSDIVNPSQGIEITCSDCQSV